MDLASLCAELALSGILTVSGPVLAQDIDSGIIYRNNGKQIFIVPDQLSFLTHRCYNQKVFRTSDRTKKRFKKALYKF